MYSFDFLFISPKKEDAPFSPVGKIYVKTHTEDKQGHIFLTPNCMTKLEIDGQVDRLIQELEEIRKRAKRKFPN